jgi:tape measure domain-containing protein
MEVASLGLGLSFEEIERGTQALRAFSKGAADAEGAAKKMGAANDAAGQSSEQFSARVKRNIDALQFQAAQMSRSSAEQERYTALRRAGVTAESAAGAAISKSIQLLQQQRQAQQAMTEAARKATEAAREAQRQATFSARQPISANQRLNLGYQLNDVFTQLAGGTNPALIAAQQGPQITQIFGGLKNTIAAIPAPALVAVGAAIAAIAGIATLNAIAKLNDELAEQQRRLTTLLGSQTEASKGYRDIATFASDAGIGIDVATEKFVAFARAGQSLGATRQNIADVASTVEKLSQLSGASPTEGTAAQGALAEMLKESTVNADQLKTVLGNVPQIADKIAAGLGVSVTQLRLMAAEGDLSNKQVFDALLKQSANVNAEFAKMPKSIGSQFQSLADDLGQVVTRFGHLIPLVREYRLGIELAAKAAKALNDATTPATPQQRAEATTAKINGADRLRTGNVQIGTNAYARDLLSAQFDQGVSDNAATFAEMAAQARAANESIVNGAAIADKLDPLAKGARDARKDTEDLQKAIDYLQSGLSGLSTEEAARQMGSLENAITRAKRAAQDIDPALKSLNAISQRNQFRTNDDTAAGMALQGRTQELVTAGSNPRDAQTAALAEQQEKIADIVKAKQQEADAEEKITAATGKGKKALIEAQVEAATLAFIMQNVGKNTEASADAIKAFRDAFRTVLKQQAAQQSIDAAKPLITELAGIAAAQDVVAQGAFAMKRAQEQAKAIRDENGNGGLMMSIFDQQQWLTDLVMIDNLKKQVDLTNQLAAAAGNVAKQKKLQLDFDIKQAREGAIPGAGDEIEKQMRAKAAADSALAYGNIIAQSKEFVAQQEVEQQAAFASTEGAARLRFEYQLLNQARQAGIEQTPDVVQGLKDQAAAMAQAQTKAQQLNELVNLGKSTVSGFFSDFSQGLQQGQSAWDAFGNAATNALNKITDKLVEMAVSDVFDAAFGKGGSSGGGLLGGILSFLGLGGGGGGGAGGMASAGLPGSSFFGPANPFFGPGFAKGGVFDRGNVIPFAAAASSTGRRCFQWRTAWG